MKKIVCRTCIARDHVEQLIGQVCLQPALDSVELRDTTIMHELDQAIKMPLP